MCNYDYSDYHEKILNIKGMDEESAKKVERMLTAKRDHRELDEEDLFTPFCSEEGKLHRFLEKVKEVNKSASAFDKRLVVCFRGKELIIYKNNHRLWEIKKEKNGYSVKFDFNHARYYDEWEKILFTLKGKDYGFVVNYTEKEKGRFIDTITGLKAKYRGETDSVIGGTIGEICCVRESFSDDFVDKTYNIFSELIESFMKGGKDQFREKIRKLAEEKPNEIKMAGDIHETGTNPYIEKRWQQRLFLHYKEKRAGKPWIFAYDLEFSQRYPNSEIKEKMIANEPDMMAIQFNDEGVAEKLLLIEVKSTYKVCWTVTNNEHHSDLWEHVKGMKAYSNMSFFIRSRINDAYHMIEQYAKTGLYPAIASAELQSILSLKDKDVRRVILFTNNNLPKEEENAKKEKPKSAMDFLKDKNMQKQLTILISDEDPDCEIWFTEDDYFSDNLEIKTLSLNQ